MPEMSHNASFITLQAWTDHDNTYNCLRQRYITERVTYMGEFKQDKECPTSLV